MQTKTRLGIPVLAFAVGLSPMTVATAAQVPSERTVSGPDYLLEYQRPASEGHRLPPR